MYEYFLTREAKEDLWRIYEFGVLKFGVNQAKKYFDTMHDCFDKIASNPFMFPEVVKYKIAVRYCVCGIDNIFYKISNNKVEIITIVGRQNY